MMIRVVGDGNLQGALFCGIKTGGQEEQKHTLLKLILCLRFFSKALIRCIKVEPLKKEGTF